MAVTDKLEFKISGMNCADEMAAKCKKEGDWCKLHDRALSQCFKCDPSKYAKFEAMYEANFGKKPPRPPEEEFMK